MAQISAIDTSALTTEKSVKAVSLYRFLNYVDWPLTTFAQDNSPYVIGVLEAEEIANELVKLTENRHIRDRAVIVKKIRGTDPVSGVHLLFIGKAERARQSQLLKKMQRQPVLLVTETEEALEQGSMINFRFVDEHVRFEVALSPVEKAGLILNSRLLAVAVSIVKGGQ